MNYDLKEWYLNLKPFEKEKLKSQFNESPKALLLIDFLDKYKEKSFRTNDVVTFLYKDEEKAQPYEKLQNRYFKLRKKLIESFSMQAVSGDELPLVPEEKALLSCRTLINRNNFSAAKRELTSIAKRCWDLNIFELLPEVLHQLIYCNQALNNFAENKKIFEEQELSIRLQAELREQQMLSRIGFDKFVMEGFNSAHDVIKKMHQLALRNKDYPRFMLNYHFSSVTLGASSTGNKLHALSRHFRELEEIIAKNPGMPSINYEPNHSLLLKYYLTNSRGMYEFMKGDIENSYKAFKESWSVLDTVPDLRVKKSENNYRNKIHIEIVAQRYAEALQTANELLEHQKQHNTKDSQLLTYYEIVQIYTYSFPDLKCDNPDFYLRKLDEYIRQLKKNDPLQVLGEVCTTKAVFLFIHKRYDEAKAAAKTKECKTNIEIRGLQLYHDLFELPFKNTDAARQQLTDKLKQQIFNTQGGALQSPLKRALKLMKFVK
jgi:hypothetical protein